MTMTVGELNEALNGVDDGTALYLLFEGNVQPVEGLTKAEKGPIAIIRGKGKPRKSKRFTVTEDGLIGGLNAMGASDAMIAELFDRSESSIKQRRTKLGIR